MQHLFSFYCAGKVFLSRRTETAFTQKISGAAQHGCLKICGFKCREATLKMLFLRRDDWRREKKDCANSYWTANTTPGCLDFSCSGDPEGRRTQGEGPQVDQGPWFTGLKHPSVKTSSKTTSTNWKQLWKILLHFFFGRVSIKIGGRCRSPSPRQKSFCETKLLGWRWKTFSCQS